MPADRALKRSLTDVPGVHVGHLTVAEGEVQTGVTAVLPYPPWVRHRKLFLGGAAAGGGNEWTGLHVAQDFGTFSSPIVLCNATTVGIAYDALITLGHRRDPELPTDDAWPPLVLGLDDGHLNDLRRRRVGHDDVLRAIEQASDGPAPCGSVGVGRGLCALDAKGGVGDSARVVRLPGGEHTLGVLVAANGGALAGAPPSVPAGARAPRATSGHAPAARSVTPGVVAVIATDAPLLPTQLRDVAGAALRGLGLVAPPLGVEPRIALAFSTANPIDESLKAPFRLYPARHVGEAALGSLLEAAAEVAGAALRRALTDATAVTGRLGRSAAPLGPDVIARLGSGPLP